MNTTEIQNAFRSIGLALNLTNGAVATDRVDAVPDENSWRVDNSKEIDLLEQLENFLTNIQSDS